MTSHQTSQQNNPASSFSQILTTELELLGSLKQLMLNEQDAVEQNNIEQLIPIADNKQRLLEQIERASYSRQAFLNQHIQGKSGLQQLNEFIAQTDSPANLKAQFEVLQTVLQECKDLNDVNAKIIALSQRSVERNLNILKGVDDKAMVYNAKGTTEADQARLSGVKA